MPERDGEAVDAAIAQAAHAAGAGGRPTLVLLHGVGGNAPGFAPLAAEFRRLGWLALAFSQPGYDGAPLPETYDLDGCARALAAWLAARRLDRVVLVGHSMGGMLAQTLIAQNLPQASQNAFSAAADAAASDEGLAEAAARGEAFRIVGLVLAHTSPAFGNPDGEFQQRFIASRTRPLDEGKSMREIAQTLVPRMMAPTASAEARAVGVAVMAVVPPQTYRLAVAAVAAFDGRAHLGSISVPTLCLAAEHDDTAAPAVLQRMAQRIPGADYQCLDALGHLAPIEDPRRWAAAVAHWCNRRIAGDTRSSR